MFVEWVQALILGVVQGLTEFIPISSSGHLVLVPYLLGWEKKSLAFDVVLHLGTMFAVLSYFRGELVAIVRGIMGWDLSTQGQIYRQVGLFIIPASVPVAVVGLLFEERVEDVFASPLAAALLLSATAGLLFAMEAVRSRRVATATGARRRPGQWSLDAEAVRADTQPEADPDAVTVMTRTHAATLPLGSDPRDPDGASLAGLTLGQAMSAGLFQCLALLPGISRSGATITGGVFAGLTREAATRFSFLLVIPALVGATLLSLGDLGAGQESATELAVGVVAAFVSGYLAIRYLVALVSRERLTGFGYYCLAASLVGIVGVAVIG